MSEFCGFEAREIKREASLNDAPSVIVVVVVNDDDDDDSVAMVLLFSINGTVVDVDGRLLDVITKDCCCCCREEEIRKCEDCL